MTPQISVQLYARLAMAICSYLTNRRLLCAKTRKVKHEVNFLGLKGKAALQLFGYC